MAGLITCEHCGTQVPDLPLCTTCGGVQTDTSAPAVPQSTAPTPQAPGAGPRPPTPAAAVAGSLPAWITCGCGADIPGDEPECPYCGTPAPVGTAAHGSGQVPGAPTAVLVLPTGRRVPVTGPTILIGRGDDSPMAADLETYQNVSRCHAVISVAGGRLLLSDLDSTNGTFLNDVRVEQDRPRETRPGDRIRLASNCLLALEGVEGASGILR